MIGIILSVLLRVRYHGSMMDYGFTRYLHFLTPSAALGLQPDHG